MAVGLAVNRVLMSSCLLLNTDTARWSGSHSRPSDRFVSSGKHSNMKSKTDDLGKHSTSVSGISSRLASRSAIAWTACQKIRCLHDSNDDVCSPSLLLLLFFVLWSTLKQHDNAPMKLVQNVHEHYILGSCGAQSRSWLSSIRCSYNEQNFVTEDFSSFSMKLFYVGRVLSSSIPRPLFRFEYAVLFVPAK